MLDEVMYFQSVCKLYGDVYANCIKVAAFHYKISFPFEKIEYICSCYSTILLYRIDLFVVVVVNRLLRPPNT